MLRDLFFHFGPDILGGLYFRFGVNLVPGKKHPVDMAGIKRICVLAAPDMDDLAALAPMIHSLRRSIPDVWITIAVSSNEVRDMTGELADEVVTLGGWRKFKGIRADWYDMTIAASPGGFASAKMAFRTGARCRLGFRYDHKGKPDTSFLFTHAVTLDKSKNEAERRLDLIHSPLKKPPGGSN